MPESKFKILHIFVSHETTTSTKLIKQHHVVQNIDLLPINTQRFASAIQKHVKEEIQADFEYEMKTFDSGICIIGNISLNQIL